MDIKPALTALLYSFNDNVQAVLGAILELNKRIDSLEKHVAELLREREDDLK